MQGGVTECQGMSRSAGEYAECQVVPGLVKKYAKVCQDVSRSAGECHKSQEWQRSSGSVIKCQRFVPKSAMVC